MFLCSNTVSHGAPIPGLKFNRARPGRGPQNPVRCPFYQSPVLLTELIAKIPAYEKGPYRVEGDCLMTSVRADLEGIIADVARKAAFEDRLKKQLNYHLLAFWIHGRELKLDIEVR